MPVGDYVYDLVGLGVNAGLAYSFYAIVKASKRIVANLKEAPDIEINTDLISRVAESNGGFLACVHGMVKASDVTIKSVARPEVVGVIWRHTIQERLVAKVMGFWMDDKRTVESSLSSVPFMLINKGIGVQIAEPAKLEDVDLTIIHEKFCVASNSLTDHIWGWMKGVHSTGTQDMEEMLVEGTQVMGTGLLTLKDEGLYLELSSALPYIITTRDKQSVIEELEVPITFLRVFGVVTACGASYFAYRLLSKFFEQWRNDRRRRAEERELEEARLRREAQGNDLPESLMCVVCFGLRDVLLVPCQHVCVCSECALKLSPRVCPVCRTAIEKIQPVFYS